MKKQKLKHRRKEATGDGGRQEAGTQMRKWVFFLSCLIRRFPLLLTFCTHWSFISLSAYVHTYTYVRPSIHSHHRSVHGQSSPSSPSTPFIKCSIKCLLADLLPSSPSASGNVQPHSTPLASSTPNTSPLDTVSLFQPISTSHTLDPWHKLRNHGTTLPSTTEMHLQR